MRAMPNALAVCDGGDSAGGGGPAVLNSSIPRNIGVGHNKRDNMLCTSLYANAQQQQQQRKQMYKKELIVEISKAWDWKGFMTATMWGCKKSWRFGLFVTRYAVSPQPPMSFAHLRHAWRDIVALIFCINFGISEGCMYICDEQIYVYRHKYVHFKKHILLCSFQNLSFTSIAWFLLNICNRKTLTVLRDTNYEERVYSFMSSSIGSGIPVISSRTLQLSPQKSTIFLQFFVATTAENLSLILLWHAAECRYVPIT